MKQFFLHDPTGRIVQAGYCSDQDFEVQAVEGLTLCEGTADLETDYVDVATGLLRTRPARPSPQHIWDTTSQQWVGDFDQARTAKLLEIQLERDRRITDPVIVYDGKRLDADARSIENVAKKLAAVSSRLARGDYVAPNTLVWRDADNLTHSFLDLASYKAWLDGLVIALEERGSQAYAWSWRKKAQLAACTSFEAIQALDLQ